MFIVVIALCTQSLLVLVGAYGMTNHANRTIVLVKILQPRRIVLKKRIKVWGARVSLVLIVLFSLFSMFAAIFKFGPLWIQIIGSLLAALSAGTLFLVIGAFIFDCIGKLIKIAKGD